MIWWVNRLKTIVSVCWMADQEHKYEEEALADIHRELLHLTPLLLSTPEKVNQYLGNKF